AHLAAEAHVSAYSGRSRLKWCARPRTVGRLQRAIQSGSPNGEFRSPGDMGHTGTCRVAMPIASVLLAPVEPVIRAGIRHALADRCVITETSESGAALIAAGERLGATLVVDRRDTVADLPKLPLPTLLPRASTASYDGLGRRPGRRAHC